jgi:hypothetical protein
VIVKEKIDQCRAWLLSSRHIPQDEEKYLADDLADGSLPGLVNVSDSLGMLAAYHGANGVVRVADLDDTGWQDVGLSIAYGYWALKIKTQAFSKTAFLANVRNTPNLTNQANRAACLLAACLVARRDDLAASVAEMLFWMSSTKSALDADYWKRREFEPFMLWLYAQVAESKGSSAPAPKLGIYARVVDAWGDPEQLASAIGRAADYHCARMDDRRNDDFAEFADSPFDLVPFEILAIRAVRERIALETPALSHDLLAVPTARAERMIIGRDSLVASVERAYTQLFGP